jgi:hypothetical protein
VTVISKNIFHDRMFYLTSATTIRQLLKCGRCKRKKEMGRNKERKKVRDGDIK